MKKQLPYNLSFVCVLILVVLPTLVRGECTCDEEDGDRNKAEALKYKIGAIVSILVAGAIGVFLPLLGKVFPALSPEKNVFFIIKAFAAGVILSTGFIHVLPDAFESLTSPCLNNHPWGEFPFTGFVAMVTAIGTLMIDAFSMSYYKRSNMRKMTQSPAVAVGQKDEEQATGQLNLHTHASHGHAHGSSALVSDDSGAELLRHRVVTQVLELGILVHSVIIGISLGASESPKTVRPLVAALTFHQFFEGLGLGGCITQAKFKARAITVMGLFFALTVPVGIGIGIWITKGYDENSPTALIVEGVLNAASAGILIYMALVDLLAADFMSPKMQSSLKLQLSANASLLLGAGLMSLLAKWA